MEVEVVRAYIATGGCAGPRSFEADITRDSAGPQPGELAPGTYGFGADALDQTCRRVASDCVAVEWPAGGPTIEVRLAPTVPEALCTAVTCTNGRCQDPSNLPCGTSGPCAGAVVEVAAGRSHSCARTDAGDVWCWGRGEEGQTGGASSVISQQVTLPGAATSLSAGGPRAEPSGHTCSILDGGEVWCWGANELGQSAPGSDEPIVPPSRATAVNAVTVDAGGRHTCAITADRTVLCWGSGGEFQLGDGMAAERGGPISVPISRTIGQLGVGDAHACALSEDGRVFCWGRADDGQLGNVTGNPTPNVVAVNNGIGVQTIGVGSDHGCFTRAGPPVTAACFGDNRSLQLGIPDDLRVNRPTAPPSFDRPETIVSIVAGAMHTCLLRQDGLVYCLGDNADGQLGRPDLVQTSTPTVVDSLSDVVALDAGFAHTCAVVSNGEVWCWGRNRFGQLGDGTTEPRFTPVRTLGLGVQ